MIDASVEGPVARIVLDRPAAHNALDRAALAEVLEQRQQLGDRRPVERVVRLGPVEDDARHGAVDACVDHASNSAKTGTWSLGLSQPRTWRAMRLPPERSARSDVAQTWSSRRPLFAASQSGARYDHQE